MPILLDTPYVYAGTHGDEDETYTMVQLVSFRVEPVKKLTALIIEYGNVVDDVWIPGKTESHRVVLRNAPEVTGQGIGEQTIDEDTGEVIPGELEVGVLVEAKTDFTDIRKALVVKAASVDGDYYDELSKELYLWLITKYPAYAGSIV